MATLRELDTLFERVRRDGAGKVLRLTTGHAGSLARSLIEDIRRGVWTTREVRDEELGFLDRQNHAYVATDYEIFRKAIRSIDIRAGEDVFVDFGSGKGRPVLLAAEYPFRRVIGVEYSKQLHDAACQNLRLSKRLVCQDVELVHADAGEWAIPPDATVLFFFNPFEGQVLAKVCDNIRASIAAAPRRITIIYVRADKFFEREIDWAEWLVKAHEFPCSDGLVAIYHNRPLA